MAFTVEQMVELVRAGLATATTERVVAPGYAGERTLMKNTQGPCGGCYWGGHLRQSQNCQSPRSRHTGRLARRRGRGDRLEANLWIGSFWTADWHDDYTVPHKIKDRELFS
jgi:hypothetical protein